MTRSVQEIFNVVIAEGFYHQDYYYEYMCLSLDYARSGGVITKEEKDLAQRAISIYQTGDESFGITESLEDNLRASNLPSDFAARLKIYQDWENRPELFCD